MLKFKISQVLMLSLVLALLSITPLLPSSLRLTYLYFIFNLLIIFLGAEAGLLSPFSNPQDHKTHTPTSSFLATQASLATASRTQEPYASFHDDSSRSTTAPSSDDLSEKKRAKSAGTNLSEKINGITTKVDNKVKNCKATRSLFFVGSGEPEGDDISDEEEDGAFGGVTGQELFAKAETFIGNFYKQLKMQREESWKRMHGFYQESF